MDTGNPPLDVDKQIVIQVRNKNDAPYNLTISSSDVKENAPSGTYIGTVRATEEDAGQTISYSLLNDDQGNFRIDSSGKVYKTKPSDYEAKVAHLITVQAMDNGNPRMKVIQLLEDFRETKSLALETFTRFHIPEISNSAFLRSQLFSASLNHSLNSALN